MRYAILSDIHSNLEALTAVTERVNKLGVDKIIGLGDLVGFHANPNECLDLLRTWDVQSVAGNHDLVAVGLAEPVNFSERAKTAIRWTTDRLTNEHRDHLKKLPEVAVVDERFVACHGSLRSPHEYVKTPERITRMFEDLTERWRPHQICFFGHTHHPLVYRRRGDAIETLRSDTVDLDATDYYLINPGSVGQSRDNDPRASFLIFDAARLHVQFVRVEYDYDACRRKTEAAGLAVTRQRRLFRRLVGLLRG